MADENWDPSEDEWAAIRRGELSPPAPRRHKTRDEFSVAEELAYQQGHTEPIETADYQQARDDALRAAGLLDDDVSGDGEPSTGDYLKRIQARGRP